MRSASLLSPGTQDKELVLSNIFNWFIDTDTYVFSLGYNTLCDIVSLVAITVFKRLDQEILLFLLELDCHEEKSVLAELVAGALHQLHSKIELDIGRTKSQTTLLTT